MTLKPVRLILACVGVLLFASLAILTSCSTTSSQRRTVRLVEAFASAEVTGEPRATPEIPATEWKGERLSEFKSLNVSGLKVAGEVLKGRTTSAIPILVAPRAKGESDNDLLHSVQVRLRATAGTVVSVRFDSAEEPNLKQVEGMTLGLDTFAWPLRTEIVADGSMKTYTLRADGAFNVSFSGATIRQVMVRPSDAEKADFEIESVRLIFRREHLAKIPSGISWQGLGDVYKETVVSRAPEKISFNLEVGSQPWLDVALGTVDEGAVTFRVETGSGEVLLRRTVTTPHRWQSVPVDLGAYANSSLSLNLSLEQSEEGTIGFWGSPVVRSRSTPAPGAPRGVILIIPDTLRRDHLESYGYERTTAPYLTSLAKRGVLFADNQSQGTWTKVSVPSILTSLYPSTHGIYKIEHRLSAQVETIAESFQKAGYATWATSSVPFSGKMTNLHQGVEELHEATSLSERTSKTARTYVDRLVEWLDLQKDGPFFARLHVFDPHSPFRPRQPYDSFFSSPEQNAVLEEQMKTVTDHIVDNFRKEQVMPYASELEAAGLDIEPYVNVEKAWYDGSIRGMDAEIGRLLEHLESLGLADDVLVAVVADHGEEFLEHGRHWHGNTVYGDQTNVPMLLAWPNGVSGDQVIQETTQSIDLMPTILELVGLPIPEFAQGVSLLPLLQGSADESAVQLRDRPVFSERKADESQPDMVQIDSLAIVADGWKLIRNTKRPDDYPEFELFRHSEDPLNLDNVAEANPDVVQQLTALLDAWHKEALAAHEALGVEEQNLSPEELERLRGLGYIQ